MRRLLAFFITLFLISCSSETNSFKVEGTAQGFDDGTSIYVYSIGGNNNPTIIDTLTIQNGAFTGSYPKSEEATVNYINVGKANVNILYFPENQDLKFTLYKDSLQASSVSGSIQNESYTSFSRQLRDFDRRKRQTVATYRQAQKEQDDLLVTEMQQENASLIQQENQYKKQFIMDNGNSLFSVMLMSEMINRKEMSSGEAKEALVKLSPKIAGTQIATSVKKLLEGMQKADVGAVAPDFSAPTPEGNMLSLQETLGEYTIIDFWASWCRPCRAENPNVVRVYNKYHDKGLNIISVSLDRNGQRDRWLKAIEDDNMDWYHVSNLKFWQDPIAKTYNVRSIPATFLLDKDGNIIAKNLRGPALEAKIASLLGQ